MGEAGLRTIDLTTQTTISSASPLPWLFLKSDPEVIFSLRERDGRGSSKALHDPEAIKCRGKWGENYRSRDAGSGEGALVGLIMLPVLH